MFSHAHRRRWRSRFIHPYFLRWWIASWLWCHWGCVVLDWTSQCHFRICKWDDRGKFDNVVAQPLTDSLKWRFLTSCSSQDSKIQFKWWLCIDLLLGRVEWLWVCICLAMRKVLELDIFMFGGILVFLLYFHFPENKLQHNWNDDLHGALRYMGSNFWKPFWKWFIKFLILFLVWFLESIKERK